SNQNLQPGIGRLTAVALTSFIPLNWICKIYSFYASYRIYLSNIRGLRYGVMATRGVYGGRRREEFFARRSSPEPHTTGHKLEDELGEPLFHRLGKTVKLTAVGERMTDYANRMLRLREEALLAAGELRGL